MKKLKFIGLTTIIIALVLGITFTACSGGSDDSGISADDFVTTGTIDGREVEVIISNSAKAVTPVTGQYYVIRFVDTKVVVSRGTIIYNNPHITFIPDDGSASFYGYFTGGALSISDVPFEEETYNIGGGGGGGGGGTFTPAVYSLVAQPSINNAPIAFTLTSRARAVAGGVYDYVARIGEITISNGTATVNNNVFTFLASNNDTFDYDATTGTVNGDITLTPAKIAELETAAGMTLSLPPILNLSSFTEIEGVSSNYWNGTWIRVSEDGTLLSQQFIFSGANYTYTDGSNTESGTFTYYDPTAPGNSSTDCVFIFYRPGNKLAVYLWEGMFYNDPTSTWLELYNWVIDPMEISVNFNLVNELFDDLMDIVALNSMPQWDIGSPSGFSNYDAAWDAYKTAYDANPNGFRKQ